VIGIKSIAVPVLIAGIGKLKKACRFAHVLWI